MAAGQGRSNLRLMLDAVGREEANQEGYAVAAGRERSNPQLMLEVVGQEELAREDGRRTEVVVLRLHSTLHGRWQEVVDLADRGGEGQMWSRHGAGPAVTPY